MKVQGHHIHKTVTVIIILSAEKQAGSGRYVILKGTISILVIRSEEVGLTALLLSNNALLGLQDVIVLLQLGVLLQQLVHLLVHDRVVARFQDRQVVYPLLHRQDLLLQLTNRLAPLPQLFLQLFVLLYQLLPQVLLLLQLVS